MHFHLTTKKERTQRRPPSASYAPLISFDHRKQSIAHPCVTLLISDLNQLGLYSYTNSGNKILHTIASTHQLHNYPFSTGHSLTDINELSESHKNSNWIEKKMNKHFVVWSILTALIGSFT